MLDASAVTRVFDVYEGVLRKSSKSPDDLHFNLALYYKQRCHPL